jgi:hypothetical protein
MPRQPIKTHQREVSRFVLQWLVLQALRCVQWDLSFKVVRKRIPVWIHLLDVTAVGISFLLSLKIPPSPFSNLRHLNDCGSSDTTGSLTFRVR